MKEIEKLAVLQQNSGSTPLFYEGRFDHVVERMKDRFNSDISHDEWQQMNADIFLDRDNVEWLDVGDSAHSSLYIVQFRGATLLVPFSETAYCVMTVFPRNDFRLRDVRANTYVQNASKSADFAYRDQRRAIAADLNRMEPDGEGRLVLPRSALTVAPVVEEPPRFTPFKDALQGFTPAPPSASRAVLTVVPTKPAEQAAPDEPSDGLDPKVLAEFATLNRRFDDQEREVSGEEENADAEIAELEARIEQIRAGSVLATMKRDFIAASRKMTEDAFDKFRAGVFTAEAALSFTRLIVAQQEAPKPPTMYRPSRIAKGLDGVTLEGPDAVCVRRGHSVFFRLDGIEDNMAGWANRAGITAQTINNRMTKGATFREAIFGRVKSKSR